MGVKKIMNTKLPNGEVIDLYPIGVLAKALDRTALTIRRWEREGIIPDTFFVNSRGHRMYSQEQIDIIVQCANEAQIKKGYSILSTEFSELCKYRLGELLKKYKGE